MKISIISSHSSFFHHRKDDLTTGDESEKPINKEAKIEPTMYDLVKLVESTKLWITY